MKRRIIRQGHNTLTVTIPTKWAKRNGIKPGDDIELEEQEGSLIIHTNKTENRTNSTLLELQDAPIQVIWRSLISAYRGGYDEITIHFTNPKSKNIYTGFGFDNLHALVSKGAIELSPIEAIQAIVNRLIGVEIIDQRENSCVIKEMGETTYKEFDNALHRIFHILNTMADEIHDGYLHNKKEVLKQIHLMDTNIDRFEDYCLRILNKIGYKELRKTSIIFSTVFLLEMIGDEYRKIALHLLESKEKPRKLMATELDIQRHQLRRMYSLFMDFDREKAAEIYLEDEKGDRFLRENEFSNEEQEIIHHLKKIGIFVLSLSELRLDLEA